MMIKRVAQVGGPIPAAFFKRKANDLCVIGQHSFHMCGVEAGIANFCYLYHIVLSFLRLEILLFSPRQRVPVAPAPAVSAISLPRVRYDSGAFVPHISKPSTSDSWLQRIGSQSGAKMSMPPVHTSMRCPEGSKK